MIIATITRRNAYYCATLVTTSTVKNISHTKTQFFRVWVLAQGPYNAAQVVGQKQK